MKKAIPKFLKLFALFAVFLQFGCSKDFYDEEINSNKHTILVQRKNFEDLKKNKKLMSSIERFTLNKSNSFQKQYYDSINNFYIDLDDVMFTEDVLNHQTYTFKINRISNNGLLENLILKATNSDDYDEDKYSS